MSKPAESILRKMVQAGLHSHYFGLSDGTHNDHWLVVDVDIDLTGEEAAYVHDLVSSSPQEGATHG